MFLSSGTKCLLQSYEIVLEVDGYFTVSYSPTQQNHLFKVGETLANMFNKGENWTMKGHVDKDISRQKIIST